MRAGPLTPSQLSPATPPVSAALCLPTCISSSQHPPQWANQCDSPAAREAVHARSLHAGQPPLPHPAGSAPRTTQQQQPVPAAHPSHPSQPSQPAKPPRHSRPRSHPPPPTHTPHTHTMGGAFSSGRRLSDAEEQRLGRKCRTLAQAYARCHKANPSDGAIACKNLETSLVMCYAAGACSCRPARSLPTHIPQ